MIRRYTSLLAAAFGAVTLLAACDLGQPIGERTPTVEMSLTSAPTASPTFAPSHTPAATLPPRLEEPSPTFTPGPPTETFTPSPTPGPYEYVIQPNDTLLYIVQLPPFNYRDPNIINEVLRLNPQIVSADRLPPPGSVILIPRQTATPTPEGFELTRTFLPPQTQQAVNEFRPENAPTVQVTVRAGETILGVAAQNSTTLVILATLNPELSFFGCDFNNPSGGPDCNVPLQVGQVVNVPALTPTPTLSPTFSGSETPTPTPTYPPPSMIFPPHNANASARTFQLQWVSVGILRDDEVYLIQIEDMTAGTSHVDITRSTSYELPESLVPTDGQPHEIRWRVSVAAPTSEGTYRIISGAGDWRIFRWQIR